MDKTKAVNLRVALENCEALKEIEENFGVKFTFGRTTYGDNSATMKL